MKISYGSHTFDADASYTHDVVSSTGSHGEIQFLTHRFNLSGLMIGADHAALKVLSDSFLDEYKKNEKTFTIKSDDDSPLLSFTKQQALDGSPRVVARGFQNSGENTAEFTTYRHFFAIIEVDVGTSEGETAPSSFSESFSQTGDGSPLLVFPPIVDDFLEAQETTKKTYFQAVQSGSATSSVFQPVAPRPKLRKSALLGDNNQIAKSSRASSQGRPEFTTTWTYNFKSARRIL